MYGQCLKNYRLMVLDGNKIHQCLMRLLNNYNENSDEIYIPEVDV